ncbi:MAG: phosphate transport system substrate-binding protein [Frankiaceae bacterium]|jgi:phosphate ABC transporter phosphate-binding protein|nr:phosphate transport system substrate-binding protein [Frankiaceae bacterium]
MLARLKIPAAAALALVALVAVPAAPAAASGHALIQGSGSSWAANAVNQWIADVEQSGLQVVFTSSGSAQGRKDFAYRTTDFAVSDIGYQGSDPKTGEDDTSQGRGFAYLPIVAGGTAFPYQVRVAGKLVRNIRLSGATLAKIFTNHITNWNDPAITKDNNGRVLPALPIIPVVHSEGSGSTAQFTRYLAKEFPSLWGPFNSDPNFTEYFPRQGSQIAQNGSDGVMNFLTSSAGNGAIGYDEYSYALGKDYPVAKIENSAGYFTAPTQYNVAVALTQAQINYDKSSKEYLLQNLDKVYAYGDKRAYPLSSYSYGIIPTDASDSQMTTAKRQTLADFLYASICQGQAEIGPIGYSALPINLVQRSFQQIALLHQADSKVSLKNENVSTCHNPTFVAGQPNRNYLAEVAPQPPACDQAGAGPCSADQGVTNGKLVNGKPTGGGGSTTPSASGPAGTGTRGARTPTTGTHQPGAVGVPATTTGQPGATQAANVDIVPQSTILPAGAGSFGGVLAGIVILELLALLALPPIVAHRAARRKAAR